MPVYLWTPGTTLSNPAWTLVSISFHRDSIILLKLQLELLIYIPGVCPLQLPNRQKPFTQIFQEHLFIYTFQYFQIEKIHRRHSIMKHVLCNSHVPGNVSDAGMQTRIKHGLCLPEPHKKNGKISTQQGIIVKPSNVIQDRILQENKRNYFSYLSLSFPLKLSKYGRKHDIMKILI